MKHALEQELNEQRSRVAELGSTNDLIKQRLLSAQKQYDDLRLSADEKVDALQKQLTDYADMKSKLEAAVQLADEKSKQLIKATAAVNQLREKNSSLAQQLSEVRSFFVCLFCSLFVLFCFVFVLLFLFCFVCLCFFPAVFWLCLKSFFLCFFLKIEKRDLNNANETESALQSANSQLQKQLSDLISKVEESQRHEEAVTIKNNQLVASLQILQSETKKKHVRMGCRCFFRT